MFKIHQNLNVVRDIKITRNLMTWNVNDLLLYGDHSCLVNQHRDVQITEQIRNQFFRMAVISLSITNLEFILRKIRLPIINTCTIFSKQSVLKIRTLIHIFWRDHNGNKAPQIGRYDAKNEKKFGFWWDKLKLALEESSTL